ncbi:MAG: alpha/beta fold hydrolase [Desulfobulbus sp.]
MKNFKLGVLVTVLFLALHFSLAIAGNIQPVGNVIGKDHQGCDVYQIDSNGIKIGYKLVGNGTPLVMIVGLGNTMDIWPRELLDTLSQKFQLILFDNRGMGFTSSNETPFTYKLFADDVIGLLDALKIQQADVLGFSMGSTITQELLLEYPSRFRKAVIYATSVDGSNVASALKDKKPKGDGHINPTVIRQLEATTHWKTPLERLSTISNQVMFIVGTSDEVVGMESSKKLASSVPGAWLVQFKKGTHKLMLEFPKEFAQIVYTFLDISETVHRDN